MKMLEHNIKISPCVIEKLEEKHKVILSEVGECFLNRTQGLLEDTRLDHQTDPPTLWFIAETDSGRLLKVVFVELNDGTYEIKTAYAPNDSEVKIYEKYA